MSAQRARVDLAVDWWGGSDEFQAAVNEALERVGAHREENGSFRLDASAQARLRREAQMIRNHRQFERKDRASAAATRRVLEGSEWVLETRADLARSRAALARTQ